TPREVSAGRVLLLVESQSPGAAGGRDEAFTLVDNGLQVTVIALRGPGQKPHEVVNGTSTYRLPPLTLFKKLPDERHSQFWRLLNKVQVVGGYVTEYAYFTLACLVVSIYVAFVEGFEDRKSTRLNSSHVSISY